MFGIGRRKERERIAETEAEEAAQAEEDAEEA